MIQNVKHEKSWENCSKKSHKMATKQIVAITSHNLALKIAYQSCDETRT